MNISDAVKILDNSVKNPSEGLPDEIFYYASSITPLINVDLLIKDEDNRTLLAWRDDIYCGKGWHIPGGIIRFQETFQERITKVGQLEIGIDNIQYDPKPIDFNELIHYERRERSHFISLLYKCFLSKHFELDNGEKQENTPGFLKWHEGCPNELLKFHEIYRKYV